MSSLEALSRAGIPTAGRSLGIPWRLQRHQGDHYRLLIGSHTVQLRRDSLGSFTTHRLVGRWANPTEIVNVLVLYDSDFPTVDGLRWWGGQGRA